MTVDSALELLVQASRVSPVLRSAVQVVDDEICRLRRAVESEPDLCPSCEGTRDVPNIGSTGLWCGSDWHTEPRKAVGIELSERFCEIAAKRMAQEVLDFGGAA